MQRRIRPDEVLPEWQKEQQVLGTQADVQREIRTALAFHRTHPQQLEALAQKRAAALLDDHRRVREAVRDVGQYSVSACLPVDVIGVYVLLPDAL